MARQQLLVALLGLLALDVALVNCHVWHNQQKQHYSDVVFPQQAPSANAYGQQNNIEIVEGTIDQLNRIDPMWMCTNRRTGDQMIFGTEIPNGNFINNGYPQHNSQLYSTGQVPNTNPWLNQRPNQGFVTTPTVDEQQPTYLKPTTIEAVRKKWADFDWTQLVTVNPTTVEPENEPNATPPNRPHAGEGIIQVRNGI